MLDAEYMRENVEDEDSTEQHGSLVTQICSVLKSAFAQSQNCKKKMENEQKVIVVKKCNCM